MYRAVNREVSVQATPTHTAWLFLIENQRLLVLGSMGYLCYCDGQKLPSVYENKFELD